MDDYDPERDGVLLKAGEVYPLLHVSRNHLANLRKRGILRGYKLHENGHWHYPSNQPLLIDARAALKGSR